MNYMKRFGKEKTQKTIRNQRPDRMLARRVLAAVTAVSVVGQPFASLAASVVTRVDTPDKNLMQGQNVGHIYAEKVVNNGNIAVNRFNTFQIGAGDIANMYFTTAANSNKLAGSLVNFVNSRIDVAGTVNAIKNNKIDGNLFFLSSSGMAVSNTGVINAGALFVMTPTQNFMKGILGDNLKDFNEENFNAQWSNISSMQIPINASGTITVEGKVYAPNGIGMKAAHIRIGAEGTAKDNQALLQTGTIDFSDLVNTKNGEETVSAGLNGDLKLEKTGSGDIVLAAVATERNEKDSSFDSSTTDNNLVHASVISNGTVSAAGDVDITATASSGEAYDIYFMDESDETADELDVWGQIVKTKADITINGVVTGQHVNAAAESHNSFITAGASDADLGDINGILGVATLNIDGGYAVLGGEASVNVGKSASITASAADTDTKKAISLTADSVVRAAAGASTSAIKLANIKHSGNIPSAGVVYAKADNEAAVTIAGSVTAEKGSMDVAADTETRLEAVASNKTTQIGGEPADQTRVNAAVTVVDGDSHSRVDIQETASVSAAGHLDIAATGTNRIDTQALVSGKESAMAVAAVNVTNYDSGADVNINANLTGSSVSVAAGNTVLENTVIADSSVGSSSLVTTATNEAVNSQTVSTLKSVFSTLKDRVISSTETVGTPIDNLADLFTLGASVGVADENFTSGVHIGNGVNISAADASGTKGDINVAANTIIADTHMQAVGVSNNYTEENDKKEVLINAGVLYADMDSGSNVTIEGGSGDAYTGLDGKNVTVAAHSEFQYNRINMMLGELLSLCDKLEGAYASNETYKAHVEELAELASAYRENVAKDPNYADSTAGNEAAMALAIAAQQVSDDAQDPSVLNQIKDIVTGPFSVAGAAAQFANPANYANFQASGGTSGDKDASAGIAGSVNINKLSNTASVLAGKNTKITASGKADVDAKVVQEDVSITGRIGLNSGTDTTAGGSVGIHMGQTDSLVAVAEGASISGSSVMLGADNDVTHTGIVINAGKGGTNGLSGMAGYMEGDSNAVVSVDDEASLTASSNGADEKDGGGLVSIDAENTTVITNIAGGAAIGQQAGIGASVGITNYTVNTVAAVADNDADAKRGEKEPVSGLTGMVHRGLTDEEKAAFFGTAENTLTGAGITAEDFKVHAVNDSVINTVTIAGGVTTGDDSDEPGIGDKFNTFIKNQGNKIYNGFNAIDTKFTEKLPYALTRWGDTIDDPGKRPTNMQPSKVNIGAKLPSLSISGAGSASVNLVSGSTASLVENANIHLTKADSTVQTGAEDSSFIGAWSGAGAISWKQAITEPNMNNTNVGLAGAVGVNVTATDVVSRIAGSSIAGAASITNTAKKSGALVAAGLGLAAAKAGQGGGKSYDGAASVSVNVSDNMVSAFMEDNKVNEDNQDGPATVLTNGAYDSDTQVTGGVNFSLVAGGERGVAVGGTVGYSELTNNVSSVISGGTYRNMGTVDVHALSDITQVGAAVGVSVSGSSGTNIGFNGVAAYNQLNNAVAAGIENAEIHAAAVGVRAQDTDLGEKKYDKYLKDRGIDANGSSYIANVNDTTEEDLENPGKTGNTIVTGALGISGATGSKGGAGAAAISISDINNDFDAHITGGSIFASGSGSKDVPDVNVYAKSDTLLVGVAAGGSGTGGNISGVGSLTWQTLDNDTIATIENATIHADSTAIRALNGSLGVNVAGQIGVGKMAMGLALAYNNLENTTGAYVKGATVDRYEDNETPGGSASLIVDGQNTSKLYAIGAGVNAALEGAAANGTIAINIGRNNTEAIVDEANGRRAKLDHISALSVTTNDQSSELALAGGVGVSNFVAVGGAVAYNEIGNISGEGDEKKQQNAAKVNHADITAEDGAAIDVSATDTSGLETASVGVGIAAGGEGVSVAVQGAAATALINKNTEASMDGTVISRVSGAENGADVSVSAESKNKIDTTADVASISIGGTNVSVGAGVAVNRSEADVQASVSGGKMDVKNLRLDAANRADIRAIGVGASVAGGVGAGVTGSVAVNQIGNKTTAGIFSGADIVASDNVVVAASGDESIANYAGSLSVAGQGAAVGLSVSVNQIDSETRASIEGDTTKVSAAGNGEAEEINDSVDDTAILDNFVDEDAFESTASLADARKNSEYSGVAVSASSTHTLKSFLINGGVAGEGAAVNGTVNVNQIGGGTSAMIKGADINAGTAAAGDVHVTAHDYANSAGLVGTTSIAGIGAGVGLGSDTNTVSRDVSAEILGKGEAGADGAYSGKNTVNASSLGVDAEAKQGISSLTTGISVGGVGAGVSNATSVALLEGKTEARVNGAQISAANLAVTSDHTAKMHTLGVAVGAAGGAGVGIGVSVLNENSETTAEVVNTSAEMVGENGEVAVEADNTTEVNYQLYNGGGGIVGVAGSIGVSNVNSKVNTNVVNTDIGGETAGRAGSINIAGQNTIDFTNKAGTGSAGAVGAGVGVAVNTIDSQVRTQVENAHLYASGGIDVSAKETRTVDQMAVNASAGGAAGGANVMVTNVGKAVESAYGSDLQTDDAGNVEGGGVDIDAMYAQANEAINGNRLHSEYTLGGVKESDPVLQDTVTAGKGGTQESIVKVDVDGSVLETGGKASLRSEETTNVKMDGINAALGLAGSVSGTVGILNVHRNSGVELTASEVQAAEFEVLAKVDGKSDLDIYQGTVGGSLSIGAAYGSLSTDGKTGVGIGGSTIETIGGVSVSAEDASQADVDAIGVTLAGGGAASVIAAEGTNRGETTVTVDNTAITAGKDITVGAKREAEGDSLHIRAIAGSGGLVFAGAGVGAVASEMGTVGTEVTGGSRFSAGGAIHLSALNAPSVSVETGAVAGSFLLASAAITVAEANVGGEEEDDHLKTIVRVDDSNTFTADTMTAEAKADITQNVDMNGISISASPFSTTGAAQVNTGSADVYSDVRADIGASVFQGRGSGSMDLTVEGSNSVTQNAAAQGISASTGIAMGTNLAGTTAHLSTQVTASGHADSRFGDVNLTGSSYAKSENNANGYGGALVDISPYAAMVENDYTADTDVTLKGTWNAAGDVTAQALNGMDIDLVSDAVRAAIVGGSGTWLDNTINNAANVTLDGAKITSGGAQSYTAQNQVDYTGEIDGSGYGGINVNATDYSDDLDFTAGVDIKGSTLAAEGKDGRIEVQALTTGVIDSKNVLKSAGVVPVALAFSKHAIDYANTITVSGTSKLTTEGKDQNIILAANDDTTVDLEAIADTQGGVAGAASSALENTMHRANTVSVGEDAEIESANDVKLFAGADANGNSSSLVMNVIADAYNNTVIPLYTDPSITSTMSQANRVDAGGDVGSVRDIQIKAGKGNTLLTTSTREYNFYTGEHGGGSIASTADGSINENSAETHNNGIEITGNYKAGIHDKLAINISGYTETTEENGLSYDHINVDITEGADWFNPNNEDPKDLLNVTTLELQNTLLAQYEALVKARMDYKNGSPEANNLDAEIQKLLDQMKDLNWVDMIKDTTTGQWIQTDTPSQSITVQGIALPDIVVSGGSISLEGDQLTGTGSASLSANGAPQLSITNSSDLYMEIHDLAIAGTGGDITFNAKDLTDSNKGNYAGTIASTGQADEKPAIKISSTSAENFATNPLAQPDIGITGFVSNPEGTISISNENHNIRLSGQGSVSGMTVNLSAAKGSVTQNSTAALLNINGDPISQYQFSPAVASKIQTYLNQLLSDGDPSNDSKSFNSYEEYVQWLITDVGIDPSDLGANADGSGIIDESAGVRGQNVYINAVNVNINGLVQAGYGDYSAMLGDDANGRIDQITASWDHSPLLDSEVMGNASYRVNTGGEYWDNNDKIWKYEVSVYYNPYTQKLLVDSVSPDGGQLYINGAVSSTGGGRLMALDGMADINIDTQKVTNEAVKGIVVNKIDSKNVEGLISITDTNKTVNSKGEAVNGLVTEYKNGSWREYEYGTAIADRPAFISTENAGSGNASYTYNPETGLRYEYTGGYKGGEEWHYHSYDWFVGWGLFKYNSSQDFHDKYVTDPHTTVTHTSVNGQELSSGVYIGKVNNANTGKDWYFTGSSWATSQEIQGEVHDRKEWGWHDNDSKKDPDWLGMMLGYGKVIYEWVTTNLQGSSTTSSLKADEGIQIGFVGGKENTGSIAIAGNQDIELAGNISNAEVNGTGAGSVSIISNSGSIMTADNAYIVSDSVKLQAETGIDVNHLAIGQTASMDFSAAGGDIRLESYGGDLSIKQAVTGDKSKDITASTGNVYIQTAGSIFDGHTSGDYAVKGQRIDLVSTGGSIGTKDKALTILAGSELTSSDTMAASINASAKDDIVLTQTEGNMRLGTIESQDGDAVLTVTNGSFVDAHPSENSTSSTAEDKINRWKEAGIINKDDTDDSSRKAAEDAKALRVGALEERMNSLAATGDHTVDEYKAAAEAFYSDAGMQTAKQTYLDAVANAKDSAAAEAAYAAYTEAQNQYFVDKGFGTEEQNVITSYAELSNSKNYGWSKNQLLYAIQDSVLNSEVGTVQTVTTPNVSAHNITLNAANGGIGIDADAKEISYNALNNVDNLKILANAKAGDLTWDEEHQKVIVRQQQAITVDVADGGEVNVTGRDNVYLAGVKDTQLDVNDIETAGDIRLQGDAGILVDGLKGQNLTIAGGKGGIQSHGTDGDLYITTDLTGTIDANATGDIYLGDVGDMDILTIASDGAVNLKAAGSILMKNVEDSQAQGYINAGTVLNLEVGNSIGDSGKALRVLDNGVVVNAAADGAIYLSGVSGQGSKDSLVLGTIKGTSFDVNSVSNVSLGRTNDESTEESEAVSGSITTTGNASITAEENIDLSNVTVNVAGGEGTLALTAKTGSVTQADTTAASITAGTVQIASAGSQILEAAKNTIAHFVTEGLGADGSINGSLHFVSGAENVAVDFGGDSGSLTVHDGSINVTHTGTGSLTATGAATTAADEAEILLTSKGSLNNEGVLESAGSITMKAAGDIAQAAGVDAADEVLFQSDAGSITVGGKTTGSSVTAATDATGTAGAITFSGDVTAATGDITANTDGGAITVSGAADAANTIHLTTVAGAIAVTGNATAGQDILATTGSGDVLLGAVDGKGTILAKAGNITVDTGSGAVNVNGTAEAGTDIKLESGAGAITVSGSAEAGNEFNAHTGSGDITLQGTVTVVTGDAGASTTAGDILVDGAIMSGGSTALSTSTTDEDKGHVMVEGSIRADDDVIVTTSHGDVTLGVADSGDTISAVGGAVKVTTNNGDIRVNGSTDSAEEISLISKHDGDIAVSGAATAGTNIKLTSGAGAITVTGDAEAGQNVSAETDAGDIAFGGDVTATAGNVTADTKAGNISVDGSTQAGTNIALASGSGAITTTSSLIAGQNVSAATDEGSIAFKDTMQAGQNISAETENGNIAFNGKTTADNGNVTAIVTGDVGGDITFAGAVTAAGTTEETGHIYAAATNGSITAENGAELTAERNIAFQTGVGNITVNSSTTAGQNITANVESGDIAFNGETTAVIGDVNIKAAEGNIHITGTVTSGTDTILTTETDEDDDKGHITVEGSIDAGSDVEAVTNHGSVTLGAEDGTGHITAGRGDVSVTTQSGAIQVNGTAEAGTDVALISGSGAIATTGSLTAAQHVLAETGSGNIQLGGSVTAAAGNIAADSGSGNITFSDTATAGQHISAETANGSIAFGGTTTANAGNVMASVTGEGNVTFGGAVAAHGTAETAGSIHATVAAGNITAEEGAALTADRDVHLQTQNGDITFNEVVNAGKALFAQAVHSGSILVRDDLTAGQDITLNTNIGDILFEGKTDDVHEKIHVTSNQGDILLKVEEGGHGDIADTNREANGDHAVIHAALGNVTTENGGIEAADGDDSDIDLYEVYAKEDSKISTAEGDLHLVNVSGNLVAVVVRKPGKQMESEHVEAATEIQIAGSNMDLDDIVQREDGDGFLTITPDGVDDNTPIDNLVIGDIRTNGGVRFNRLWLNTGDIHVSSGAFHLDKLYVEDKATFSTPHMTTDVFGSAPVYDDTRDSAYWINTDINRPNSDLNAWKADGTHGQWMYLHFDADSPVQHSNGNLLHLQDHNDTYSQRYSMTDWMNIFSDKDFYRFYDRYYAPELSYHDRYGLIDGAGVSADNAESDEITVE